MPHFVDQDGHLTPVRWNQLPEKEHFVQIYPSQDAFLDLLEGFVAGGLRAGEGVVVIATPLHLEQLGERLQGAGFDLEAAARRDEYIALDADRTLRLFMHRGWPDEQQFEQVISGLLKRAGRGGRRVRAFGEMVVLLWEEGHTGATIHLEQMWHKLCNQYDFSLFCAYPQSSFRAGADLSAKQICATHSRMIQA